MLFSIFNEFINKFSLLIFSTIKAYAQSGDFIFNHHLHGKIFEKEISAILVFSTTDSFACTLFFAICFLLVGVDNNDCGVLFVFLLSFGKKLVELFEI